MTRVPVNLELLQWAREHSRVVQEDLAARLKTAYAEIKPHRRASFEKERSAFWAAQKG